MEMHVMGTIDPADPQAAKAWGPRVHAFATRGPSALQYAPEMPASIAGLNPDIVDVQGLWTYSSVANLDHTRRSRKPYIVTPRGMLDPWARNNSAWKKKIAGAVFERGHLRGASCLRATAEMEAQHFRDMGLINPIAIIPNGITLPNLARRTQKPLRNILFLSRIHPKKGVDFLLNSWAALEPLFPDWELIIAGIDENGHEEKLQRQARQLKLARARFVGPQLGEGKQELYRNADIFVLPTHAENFGLVIAEALAQETPVITTTNAPWSGLAKHNCGWSISLDQRILTDTMKKALSRTPDQLSEMGARGREWISRDFGSDQVASRMRELYLWLGKGTAKPDHIYD
jgi:glycosyltransferase involved in cell wall biosynthesis